MIQKQATPTLPTPDAASSSSWNTKETIGEPMIDLPVQTKKPSQKEMADDR